MVKAEQQHQVPTAYAALGAYRICDVVAGLGLLVQQRIRICDALEQDLVTSASDGTAYAVAQIRIVYVQNFLVFADVIGLFG